MLQTERNKIQGFYFLLNILKGKETHIQFGCYLYHRCINYVNESLFEMLNIHI